MDSFSPSSYFVFAYISSFTSSMLRPFSTVFPCSNFSLSPFVSPGETSLVLLVFTYRIRFPFSVFVFAEHAYPELHSLFQINLSETSNSYANASRSLLKIINLTLGLYLSSLQLHQIADLQSSYGHLLCSILLCHF